MRSVLSFESRPLVMLVGPTAIGKSAVGVSLARSIGAEIISCDSMQVYKGMECITSTPGPKEQSGVRHHLLGVASAWQEFDVFTYRSMAAAAVRAVSGSGKLPLFVGGTGLYVSVLLDGIFEEPARDERLRRKLASEARQGVRLHDRLVEIDFAAARKIHPNDTRRIIRALEVYLLTGKKISELQKQRRGLIDEYAVRIFGLRAPLKELYRRIEARVDAMFARGAVEEVRRLLKKRLSRTAGAAIGIKEIQGCIAGAYDEAEARELMKKATRQYARRQMTWFRKEQRVEWIDVGSADSADEVARRIEEKL